jgi:hypothetical protein
LAQFFPVHSFNEVRAPITRNYHEFPFFLIVLINLLFFRIDDLIKLAPERGEEQSYQQALASGQLG